MKQLLHVDSITKSFDLNRVLSDVYMACETGEIIGLLGKNGSGKSTLLKIIFGSLAADSKFIRLNDELLSSISSHKGRIQYLPQQPFLPALSKVKNLIKIFCTNEKEVFLCSHPFIKKFLNQRVNQLSGGEQRLLELMLLIHSQAAFVLIDEPFNGVAPIYKEEIKEAIKRESKDKGFIITDHDYRNILTISSHFVLLHDGGTKHLENPEELVRWGYVNSLE